MTEPLVPSCGTGPSSDGHGAERGVPMPLLILVAALVILDILAHYFGVDSRDGFDQVSPVR
jgi:hypothetical protein